MTEEQFWLLTCRPEVCGFGMLFLRENSKSCKQKLSARFRGLAEIRLQLGNGRVPEP